MAVHPVHVANAFDPDPVSIIVGDTVEWVWDQDNHSATADDGTWDSGVLNKGAKYTHTFKSVGEFPYYCVQHGGAGGIGMSSSVNVS
jgi:plastocyanin